MVELRIKNGWVTNVWTQVRELQLAELQMGEFKAVNGQMQ